VLYENSGFAALLSRRYRFAGGLYQIALALSQKPVSTPAPQTPHHFSA